MAGKEPFPRRFIPIARQPILYYNKMRRFSILCRAHPAGFFRKKHRKKQEPRRAAGEKAAFRARAPFSSAAANGKKRRTKAARGISNSRAKQAEGPRSRNAGAG